MGKSSKQFYVLISIIILIFVFGNIVSKNDPSSNGKSSNKAAVKSQKTSNENGTNNTSNRSGAGMNTEQNNITGGFNFKIYVSPDNKWQISLPQKFKSPNDARSGCVVFRDPSETISVLSGNNINELGDEFKSISKKQIIVAEEKGEYEVLDSVKLVQGKPEEQIVVVTFTHDNINYQISDRYDYNAVTIKNKPMRFGAMIKSFGFLK